MSLYVNHNITGGNKSPVSPISPVVPKPPVEPDPRQFDKALQWAKESIGKYGPGSKSDPYDFSDMLPIPPIPNK